MNRLRRSTDSSPSPHDMPANSYPTPGPSTSGRKNKIVSAMKRSFPPRSPRLPKNNVSRDGGYPYFYHEERAGSVPTVEQISMGLHLSRTPHLRSASGRGRSMSPDVLPNQGAKPAHRSRAAAQPPKPALKKVSSLLTTHTSATPSFTNVSTSTSTTLSSALFHTDRHTSFFPPRLLSRMTKIIPSSQGRPSRDIATDSVTSLPKKLVRFSVDETQ